jgi:hypothetical protein
LQKKEKPRPVTNMQNQIDAHKSGPEAGRSEPYLALFVAQQPRNKVQAFSDRLARIGLYYS